MISIDQTDMWPLIKSCCTIEASYRDITDETWHQIRTTGIGGSEASTVMGVNKYNSPLRLCMVKTGRLVDSFEGNEETEVGTILEPLIRRYVLPDYLTTKSYGKDIEVIEPDALYRSIQWPWMIGNVDGFIVIDGVTYGLEIKTGSSYTLSDWGGKGGHAIPPWYYAQVQHYMAVTGLDSWVVFALVGNARLLRVANRDHDYIQDMIEREQEMWETIQSNDITRFPLPIGLDADFEAMDALVGDGEIEIEGDLLGELQAAKAEVAGYEEEVERLKQAVVYQLAIAEAERAHGGGYSVTYKEATRKSIDTKNLAQDHPDLAAAYERETKYRTLRVKELTG